MKVPLTLTEVEAQCVPANIGVFPKEFIAAIEGNAVKGDVPLVACTLGDILDPEGDTKSLNIGDALEKVAADGEFEDTPYGALPALYAHLSNVDPAKRAFCRVVTGLVEGKWLAMSDTKGELAPAAWVMNPDSMYNRDMTLIFKQKSPAPKPQPQEVVVSTEEVPSDT